VSCRWSAAQELIHTQQYYHWLHYRANRLRAAEAAQQGLVPQTAQPSGTAAGDGSGAAPQQ